jgi:hypothetical protein
MKSLIALYDCGYMRWCGCETQKYEIERVFCYRTLMKVGDLFEFPIKYIGFDMDNNSGSRSIDYAAIFQHQKEEFVEKMTRQAVLARYLSSLCWGEESGIPSWQFPVRPPETAIVEAGGGTAIEKIVCLDCGRDFLTEEMLQSKDMFFT